jgi:hypothetical protein
MISPNSADRLRFSRQKLREPHHRNQSSKKRIWFYDQPPAKTCREVIDNISDGSVCQYMEIYPGDCRWCWNLIVVRFDGVDGWADVWGCHLGRDNTDPSISLLMVRSQIDEIVRHLFGYASKCRKKLPVGFKYLISPKAVEALLAAAALAGAVRR